MASGSTWCSNFFDPTQTKSPENQISFVFLRRVFLKSKFFLLPGLTGTGVSQLANFFVRYFTGSIGREACALRNSIIAGIAAGSSVTSCDTPLKSMNLRLGLSFISGKPPQLLAIRL